MVSYYSLKAPTGLSAVVVLVVACGTMGIVRGQTALSAKMAVRPLTRSEIAPNHLPASTQISSGLRSVALGEPAYLEVQVDGSYPASDIAGVNWTLTLKPAGSKAVLDESPLENLPVYEPSDRLILQVASRKMLHPDVVGEYVVSATVTSTKGASATVAQTIIGATYVGIATCVRCHSGGLAQNMAQSWSKTAHANLFKDGVNGVASDHYSTSCIACHTVGYDAGNTVSNGSFSDVAGQLKWTMPTVFQAGNWDKVPDQLKNVANIQCESCHGPGSVHASSGGNRVAISVSSSAADCGQCHDAPTHHIKNAEWNNSRHAIATRDPSGAGREGCVACHTGPGFVGQFKAANPVNTDYTSINCQTCHEPHGQTAPAGAAHLVRTLQSVSLADGTKVSEGGAGMLCMNCHKSRQNAAVYAAGTPGSARFGPHHGPQADMLAGANGFTFGQMIPSSAHWFVVEDTCVTCHMQTVAETDPALTRAGGHTFKPSALADAKNPPVQLVAACQKCHGPNMQSFDFPLIDYDGDGKIDGVQTEVQHLLDQLSTMLPPVGSVKSSLNIDSTWTQPQLEAGYNWLMVNEDGSRGIHNTAYTVGLLKASMAVLSNKGK